MCVLTSRTGHCGEALQMEGHQFANVHWRKRCISMKWSQEEEGARPTTPPCYFAGHNSGQSLFQAVETSPVLFFSSDLVGIIQNGAVVILILPPKLAESTDHCPNFVVWSHIS